MTSFSKLFKVMQLPKLKIASWIYLVQLVGMIAIGLYFQFSNSVRLPYESAFLAEAITLVLAGLFLYFYLLNKEIKSYKSQTWQLMPVSTIKLYLTNQLTTYLAIALFLVFQVINFGLILGAFAVSYPINFSEISKALNNPTSTSVLGQMAVYMISLGCLFVLSAISFMVIIIFLVMVSQVIVNLLPGFKSKNLVNLVRIIIGIIGYLIIGNVSSFAFESLLKIKDNPLAALSSSGLSALWTSNGISLLFILVITAVNLYLLKRFFEAKAN